MRNICISLLLLSGYMCTASAAEVNVSSIGLISGDPAAAATNSRLFKQLVSPPEYGGNGSFVGNVSFDPSKVYYFDDVIAFKENIHLDLRNSTLHFSKTAEGRDQSSGFIFALRNFTIANGKVEVDYDGQKIIHSGAALQLGQRYSNRGIYFPNNFDSLMQSPMGQIEVRNLSISTNNPAGGCGISMTGGLVDVNIDSVQINGNGRLVCGIYYEFGQATKPTQSEPFYTSHAHRMKFSNISINNLTPTGASVGIGLGGAYDVLLEQIKINGARTGIYSTAGESAFFKPWGDVPAQRTITLKGITMSGITGTAFNLSGSDAFTGGYLGRFIKDPTPEMQTDLLNYVISNFSAEGTGGGWGIYTSGGTTKITNGKLGGFVRGIVATDDAKVIEIDAVDIYNTKQQGIQLNFGAGIWKSARPKSGYIRNCTISVRSNAAGVSAKAITVNNTSDLLISNNTVNFDGRDPRAQPIYIGPTAKGVRVERTKTTNRR